MAIKDQCARCTSFSEGLCKRNDSFPEYDQTSCSFYIRKRINLDKEICDEQSNLLDSTGIGNKNNIQSPDIQVKQRMFQNPFIFKGRIRRMEFGLSYIIVYIYAIFAGVVVGVLGGDDTTMFLYLIPANWFLWAQGAKRCHDRGHSGWYQFIPCYLLWMLFGDGDAYENYYGPDPKGRRL